MTARAVPLSANYRRILLIRTDRVGDLVLSTPAISSFRRSWPKAHITALVTEYTEPVLRHNRDIDELEALPAGSKPSFARARARALGETCDLAVALAPRTDDLFLAAWSGAKRTIGYVYRRRYLSRLMARVLLSDFCISDADPALADRHPQEPVVHEVRQVLALVTLAGGAHFVEDLTLRLGPQEIAFARERAPAGGVVVTLAPRFFERTFGAATVATLIRRLANQHAEVVVTYGAEVSSDVKAVREQVKESNVTWLGDLPLLRWSAVLAQAGVVVTVDTGATHVAAALGVPVVVIFEREYYRLCSQEWSPWRVPSALLVKPPVGADPGPLIEDITAATETLRNHREIAASS